MRVETAVRGAVTADDIYERIAPIFRDVFDDDALTIGPETTAADVEGWDSLAHIRLIVSVERSFGIKFTAAEVGALENVGDFVALIGSKA
jgi:acyl carrier protein